MLPNDLPPNVQPPAAVLVAQALDEQKFNKPLDAMSSEFFSAGENLVELRVKLLAPKVTFVQSIKPRGPSLINGQTTVSTSSSLVAEEVFNDLKRSQTGGVRQVDESSYEVRLRRWTGPEPVEWTGRVTGAPSFFPLATVDLLVAGNNLAVFDKQNRKLFESKLTYPVSDRFTTGNLAHRLLPATERVGTLYFFDQGILTAFSLPDGAVRWRLTSFGISAIQFDAQGMLYVNSTAAGPEDIQYSDTITFQKIPPVLLKVDPAGGKILWKAEHRGERCLVSGKFLYAVSVERGGIGMANALAEALNSAPGEAALNFHLYRMDPATGETLWDLYDHRRPDGLAVQDNHILLLFSDDLELFRYLSL
jgi:outer membrane protein assembly factor BamB